MLEKSFKNQELRKAPEGEGFSFDINNPKIETESDFWTVFDDARNHLLALKHMAQAEGVTDIEFMQLYSDPSNEYLKFDEYLKKGNIVLPENFRQNKEVHNLIQIYDGLLERLKKVQSKKDFLDILPEINDIGVIFDLGIYDEEK